MTDVQNQTQDQVSETTEAQPTEMDLLRARAEKLGIPVPPNIKADTLRKRIDDRLNGTDEKEKETEAEAPAVGNTFTEINQRARALVRVSIVCNDPGRRDLKGEYWGVANRYIGQIRRFIPYDARGQQSWHIEHALLRMLQRKMYYRVHQEIDPKTGRVQDNSILVPLFNIQILPPLTDAERAALAQAQAAQKD